MTNIIRIGIGAVAGITLIIGSYIKYVAAPPLPMPPPPPGTALIKDSTTRRVIGPTGLFSNSKIIDSFVDVDTTVLVTKHKMDSMMGFVAKYSDTVPNGPFMTFKTAKDSINVLKGMMLTQSAADLLYRPISYVPGWNDIPGKPSTFSPTLPIALSGITGAIDVAGARSAISLTTSGSGAASYSSSTGILNIPTPAGAQSLSIAGRSITLSGSGGTVVVPKDTQLLTLSNDTIFLSNGGGFVKLPAPLDSAKTRNVNGTGYIVNSTKRTFVNCSVNIAVVLSLVGAQTGMVYLETSPNNSTWTTIGTVGSAASGVIGLGNTDYKQVSGPVPSGYYARLRATTSSGAVTIGSTASCYETHYQY